MSYTELFKIKNNGEADYLGDVKNSWRGAMAIWRYLEEKYLPKKEFSRFITNEMQEVWDLSKDNRLEDYEKKVLQSTFDNVLVKRENIPLLLRDFASFKADTNLPKQIDLIKRAFENDDDLIAIGWNQTSVNGDNWVCYDYNEETDETIRYNINTMDSHWFLYSN